MHGEKIKRTAAGVFQTLLNFLFCFSVCASTFRSLSLNLFLFDVFHCVVFHYSVHILQPRE